MRLLSWNVAGRQHDRLDAQLDAVLCTKPDVIALQEITARTYESWSTRLTDAGYAVVSTVALLDAPYPGGVRRKNCNLVAARGRVDELPGLTWKDPEEAARSFPEKHLAVRVALKDLALELQNAHLPPGSSRGIVKPEAFRAIARRLEKAGDVPQVLCGDFNSPRAEDDDGLTPFGQRHPEIRWWGEAELTLLDHKRLRDVYRHTRPRESEFAVSHRTRSGPKRYDHVYADPEDWRSMSCAYRTDWLDARLSDHAAVIAELDPHSCS